MTSSDWAFELVSAAQRFICDTSDMDLSQRPEAARRFCDSFPEPANLAGRALLRSTLIEISSRWEDGCHLAIRSRCLTTHCAPAALAGLGRSWSGSWQEPKNQRFQAQRIFIAWIDAFCVEVERTHPESLARRVAATITANLAHPLRVDDLATSVGAHQASVRRAFHREFHMSLGEYQLRARVEQAEFMLRSTPPLKVETVALAVGWGSRKDLYRAVRKVRGCTPGALRSL